MAQSFVFRAKGSVQPGKILCGFFLLLKTGWLFPKPAQPDSGLWLGDFGKTGLFMCQSVPGPLSLFCDTELHFLGAVCRLSPWYVFSFKNSLFVSETGLAGLGGFGSGLLVRQGFLCAKASHPDRAGRRVEGSCIGFWKSKANSTFCKVVKQKGETFWHRKSHLLCKSLVPKLQNSAKPNSGDSLPVFALECFFANETGVLISEFSAS